MSYAPKKNKISPKSIQRVKVYRLNDDGKWDDQGTGHVTVDYIERSEELGLLVLDEDDNETLLLHRISAEDIYRKQEDTIISWRDPEYSTELALSFQETTGCSYIWDNICSVQRNMHFSSLNNETFHSVNSDLRELPPVELSTLSQILKTVVESGIADQLRVTELILHDQDFFRKLMDLFSISEDLENIENLHILFKIVRGIIMLNSSQIFEKIFGDELIIDIIGCLEYDPDAPHVHHRNFLKEHVVFKEAIAIKDPIVLSKIHQTYRVGYLKDVILPRMLDDATVANLNSIIHSNNAVVVSLLKDDSTFIQDLFGKLKSPSTSAESKKNLVHFLHEFCTLSKSLQVVQQHRLFRDLVNEGIFDIIADVLQSQDKKLVLTGTDILILFLNQDPNLLRSYVIRQEGLALFGLLVKGMLTDFGDDMHCQFLEILRSLLDSYASGTQREAIVEVFYEKHLSQLIDAITSSCPADGAAETVRNLECSDGGTVKQSSVKPEILLNICDLLCFCIVHHPYRIKCNFLLNNVIDKVLFLTRRKEKYLVVAAVRFMRTLISRNQDEHLMNYIAKHNLLKPVVDAFFANGDRYNLLNSAVLELFEHIRKDNLKILLKYLVDSFWDELVKFEKLTSIHSLKIKYEQSLDCSGTRSVGDLLDDPRKRVNERGLEKEEEEYFNEDSDEEDSASASVANASRAQAQPALLNGSAPSPSSVRSGALVDYDDDEDDEDYKPPPRKQSDNSDEDAESFPLKRKLSPKEEPEPKRLQRIAKGSKSRDGVFAALCSTLSQAVLPSKKTVSTAQDGPCSDGDKKSVESNHEEKGNSTDNGSADLDNHDDQEPTCPKSFSESMHSSPDNRQRGDEHPLIPPKSSPEMAVNGS
ncbi:PREDICTED: serine/threonine-protein phosphatase 4 regulatory subunit 3 isoform X1 [Nicotiana attenuata]|uniref:serine/threonine-protein phosphatase 4 regulatory subunit 3 isoform X1 n=2 Tax=Nicotiana attenuata TaxID=49451 RepID=UPI0009058FCE|nr:PREDICTED: serine/threonine-protein phosphatase 4 regulatory subunit 3 isoform X1 [Nicotiana attenuata]